MAYLQGAESGTASATIWNKMKEIDLPVEKSKALEMVKTGEYAFMTDETQLQYIVSNNSDDFVTAGYVFHVAGLAFAVGKKKPYLHEFSHKYVHIFSCRKKTNKTFEQSVAPGKSIVK